MIKVRKKPVIVEAEQWFKLGDIPEAPIKAYLKTEDSQARMNAKCTACKCKMEDHGMCETLEGHHIVCPGDWIIRGIKKEYYPVKPDIFEATYEKVEK